MHLNWQLRLQKCAHIWSMFILNTMSSLLKEKTLVHFYFGGRKYEDLDKATESCFACINQTGVLFIQGYYKWIRNGWLRDQSLWLTQHGKWVRLLVRSGFFQSEMKKPNLYTAWQQLGQAAFIPQSLKASLQHLYRVVSSINSFF